MITYFYITLLLATGAVSVSVYDQAQITNYAPNHENYEPAQYAYSYGVSDPLTGDQKHHWEKRQGDQVQGEYGLMEPDGYARIVQYTADPHNGFQATVKRIHVPVTEKTQGKPLYAEKDQEQLYDNVRYGVTITHNVAPKEEQSNTHRVQQRVDNSIVQRDVNARPKKIVKKNDNSVFVDDGIVATTFRPEYNLHPKIRPIPTFVHQNMPFYQTSQLQVQQYSSNPIRYTRTQYNPEFRPQGIENHRNVQINYKQQLLPDQLHGYQQNIQNIPVQSSQNIQYQQAQLQPKNIPAQYPKLVYQSESEPVQPEREQYESQETRTTQTENTRSNDENVGYHEVQVQNEKIPTQVYKNYGYENDEKNERYQAPIESPNIAKETNQNLHQSQIESGPEQNVFYQSKEYINTQFQDPQKFISDQPYIQAQLQNDQNYPNRNGYQSIPIQTHDERPSYIVGDSKLNQYRAEFQQYFNQPSNPQTNSQRSLSQQKDIPVIFLHAHGKVGLPFLPSTPLVKYPIEHDKQYGYEGIPTQNVTSYSLHHVNAVVERRNAHIAERRNIREPYHFHGIDNIQPQQQILKNWYPTPRPETIWQAGDPTADIEPETLVRQINETCAYFRFNETTKGTEDGSRNNIWNAGDYSAQREEEELIRSVNVTCQNFTLDVLSNFTGLYSLAEYCTECLPSEEPNENKQDFDVQPPVGFIQQSGYLNFDPQRNIFPNYELQQNGYQNSASQQGGFASVPQNVYQNYVPQKNSFSTNPVLQQHRYSNVGSPRQTAFSNIVLVKYQPEVTQPFPFGGYNNRQENRDYQTQLVRQAA